MDPAGSIGSTSQGQDGATLSVSIAGANPGVVAAVARLCQDAACQFRLSWTAESVAELVRSSARTAADLLVLDPARLGSQVRVVLAEFHAVAPATRSLLVGPSPGIAVIAEALSYGLRGCIAADRVEADLARALVEIGRGQIWFTRVETAELLGIRMPGSGTNPSELWRNLPALSAREFAVMHEVLQGQTNKQIARSLNISAQTVKIHLQNIYRKLRIHRRIELLLLHGADATLRDRL